MVNRTRELSTLLEVSRNVTSTLELEPLLSLTLDQLQAVVDYGGAAVMILEHEEMRVLAYRGSIPQEHAASLRFPLQEARVNFEVVRRREPVIISDVRGETPLARAFRDFAGESLETVFGSVRCWMGVPLIAKERVIGMLSLDHAEPNHYTPQNADLAQAFAAHVAVAIENARLFAEAQQRAEEQAVLNELGQALTACLNVEQVLDEAYRGASRLLDTTNFYIALYNPEKDEVTFAIDVKEGELRKPYSTRRAGGGLTEHIIHHRTPLLLAKDLPERLKGMGIDIIGPVSHSWLGVPLLVGDRVLGVMAVQSYSAPPIYDEHDRDLLMAIANPVAIAVQNARLFAQVERRMRELEALYQADEQLYQHLNLDQVLKALVDVAVNILQADKSSLMVWDDRRENLVVRVAHGFSPETMAQMSFSPGEGSVGQVAITGEPAIVEDTHADPHVASRITDPEGIRSFMHVPIEIEGQIFGVFNVDYVQPRTFGDDELRLFTALAQRAALAIENAQLYGQAQELAVIQERQRLARDLHDAVTQTLFSATLIAEVLPRIWEHSPQQGRQRLDELRELTRGALAEMRALLLELRPSTLAEAELGDLLRQLAESITGRARVPVVVEIEPECPMPPEVKVALYRIAQEALNNVHKHAAATQANVSLRCGPDALRLHISDNGRGFDVTSVPPDHMGVGIMRERAQSVGAALEIDSQIGGGTRVKVVWAAERQGTPIDDEG